LSVAERIWGVMQELVIAVAELFGLTDEDIYQAIINREEDMKHICDIYRLKPAS
ncbi:IS4 family transposase, partial [Bacteroides gallinaceum]|nr:IS4 family transposase [Bacteroides gallinaceum]